LLSLPSPFLSHPQPLCSPKKGKETGNFATAKFQRSEVKSGVDAYLLTGEAAASPPPNVMNAIRCSRRRHMRSSEKCDLPLLKWPPYILGRDTWSQISNSCNVFFPFNSHISLYSDLLEQTAKSAFTYYCPHCQSCRSHNKHGKVMSVARSRIAWLTNPMKW
jgi:hypothetical protein